MASQACFFMHETESPAAPSANPVAKSPANHPARGREPKWRRWQRRWIRSRRHRTRLTNLPVLIQVFAGFTKVDGEIEEREIDQALGFLRYDFPEQVYSELRELYREALRQPQDLNEMAKDLAGKLATEDKILLGVQLYALISRADLHKDNLIAFYLFMTNLGIASEAIDIVYQLNTSDLESASPQPVEQGGEPQVHPLETLQIAREQPADVVLPGLSPQHRVVAFRYQELILVKNIGAEPVIMRGRQILQGEFIRLFEAQRILLGEMVLDYQDLVFYFNAKKEVSETRLFVSFGGNGDLFLEKAKSKQSHLELEFGLGITVNVLRQTPGEINGQRLEAKTSLNVTLRDKIVFDDRREIYISDLRRRARVLGSRFDLNPTRSDYRISNNPTLLREGDILLSAETTGELLLHISCDYEQKTGQLEVVKSDRPILIDHFPVKTRAALKDGDTITIGDGQFLRCHFSEGIIEEEKNVVSRLQVEEVRLSYAKKHLALDSVSFSVQRGEMVCVMGPSGCGKSTLLRTLAGQLEPDKGKIRFNGVDLYQSRRKKKRVTPYLAFIPHEEATDPLLSVEENLDFAAAIRAPHLKDADRKRRVDTKLLDLGLSEMRHRWAGDDSENKTLSGGQRKRLNVGLDMVGICDVYLFDEPTSGLSSKDSEHVLEIIRGLAHNKVVLVSIHQPSSRLFHMFHKAILLDHGGKLAFFGTPQQMLEYFHKVEIEEGMRPDLPSGSTRPTLQPDLIFDVLETPLRDLSGDVVYEEDRRGHLTAARRFSPDFWRDRFQTHHLMAEVLLDEPESDPNPVKPPPFASRSLSDEVVQISTLFKRSFLSKLRNRGNLATTLLLAPVLAILIASVLRYSEEGNYNLSTAAHIPTYLFLTLLVGLFLGLMNSAEDILRDRVLLQRERNHRLRASCYVITKIVSLSIFALVQCVFYLLIGGLILSIHGLFWLELLWMGSTAIIGVIIGLFISSIVPNIMTALNIIPLILIPQIILGGALIKYEEMNRGIDLINAARGWFRPADERREASKLEVPGICQLMPLRWSYEGLVISHAEQNPMSAFQNELEGTIESLAQVSELSAEEEQKFDNAKEALAILAGLRAENSRKLRQKLRKLRKASRSGTLNPADFDISAQNGDETWVTAEELYLNEEIQDLFTRAEMERTDYRRKYPPNVFFGAQREYRLAWWGNAENGGQTGLKIRTVMLDSLVLAGIAVSGIAFVWLSVRRRMLSV